MKGSESRPALSSPRAQADDVVVQTFQQLGVVLSVSVHIQNQCSAFEGLKGNTGVRPRGGSRRTRGRNKGSDPTPIGSGANNAAASSELRPWRSRPPHPHAAAQFSLSLILCGSKRSLMQAENRYICGGTRNRAKSKRMRESKECERRRDTKRGAAGSPDPSRQDVI